MVILAIILSLVIWRSGSLKSLSILLNIVISARAIFSVIVNHEKFSISIWCISVLSSFLDPPKAIVSEDFLVLSFQLSFSNSSHLLSLHSYLNYSGPLFKFSLRLIKMSSFSCMSIQPWYPYSFANSYRRPVKSFSNQIILVCPHVASSFVLSSFIPNFYRCFFQDFSSLYSISLSPIFFKKNKWYAKFLACHQFNLMKDDHYIILILVHQGDFNYSPGLVLDINSLSQVLHLFLPKFQVFSLLSLCEASSKSLQGFNLSLFNIQLFISSFHPSVLQVVLHGDSSRFQFFLKVFFKILVVVPQVFFLLHSSAILPPLSFEVVF